MKKKSLTSMTRDELRAEAKRLNIPGRGSMTKSELLAACLGFKAVPAADTYVADLLATEPPKKMLNHVALVVDRSGSMSHLKREAVETVNAQIEALKEQARKTGQETTLTIVMFNDRASVMSHLVAQPIENFPQLNAYRDYHAGGSTALFDAVGVTVNELIKHAKTPRGVNTSYLVLTITDGEENSSCAHGNRHNPAPFRKLLEKYQATDQWSFAFLLPEGGYRDRFLSMTGLPKGNTMEWKVTSEGIKEASAVTVRSLDSYYSVTRASGKRKTTNFFVTDLSKVTPQQVQNLEDLSPRVAEASVDQDSDVQSYCQRRFNQFRQGAVFYELMKTEKIQPYKKILIMEKNGARIFGGKQARDLLGLPNYEVKVKPGDHANYWVFVQSTSVNRKLKQGTKVLFAPSLA